jgi:hypothetical protein
MSNFRLAALLLILITTFSPVSLQAVTYYGYCRATDGSMAASTKIYEFSSPSYLEAGTLSNHTYTDQFSQYTLSHYGFGSNYTSYSLTCSWYESKAAAAGELARENSYPNLRLRLVPWIPPGTSATDDGPSSSTPQPNLGQAGGMTGDQYREAQRQADQNVAKCKASHDCHATLATSNPLHPVDPAKLPKGCKYTSEKSSEVECL